MRLHQKSMPGLGQDELNYVRIMLKIMSECKIYTRSGRSYARIKLGK